MDPASTTLKIVAVLLLIGVHAFFVAAEQSLLSARRTRIEPLARSGGRRAGHVHAALAAPADALAAAQVGATLATLGIGYLTHDLFYALLQPPIQQLHAMYALSLSALTLTHAVALLLTLLLVALLHAVFAAQLPRLAAGQKPERIALWTTPVTRLFAFLLRPLLRLISAMTLLAARALDMPPVLPAAVTTNSTDELRLLVEQAPDGVVEAEQEQMLLGVIQFRDTLAREVMTPRRDIIALPLTATRAETLALVAEEGHSRVPVYNESIDDVVGILLVKDLLAHVIANPTVTEGGFDIGRLMREPYFVPDTKRIGELLPELRTKSVHMAIVLDEFGGTDGLVTLEDMLEEIVGDIYDEHDVPEEEEDFALTESGDVLIDGSASIFDVNERFGLSLPEQDYDTIGGFVFGELGRVPVAGDIVPVPGSGALRVDEVEERRVTRVRLISAPRSAADADAVNASVNDATA